MPIAILSIAQMREWEKASWNAGRSEAEVIRRVGKIIAQRALQLTKPGEGILILAGKGHNGDDARCAREHLGERRVDVLEVKDAEADFPKLDASLSLRPALIIDGLFGIGINRRLDVAWIKLIERVNAAQLPVLAVDTPSGLNADSGEAQGAAIVASVTLTVGAPKIGLLKQNAWPYVGRLEVANEVGLIPCLHRTELSWTLPEDFSDFPPSRPADGHKGTFGHLAIIAGSSGYHGAAVLAARAAQRAQPGLISLFTHEPVYYPVAAQLQSVMVHSWSAGLKLPGDFDAVLIGPGLASPDIPEEMKHSARRLWNDAPVPVIADASALDWLPQDTTSKNSVRVLTPHPGEAARLLKTTVSRIQADRIESLREVSRRFGNSWVVLKGHQTLIGRSEGEIFVNSSGNPFLAQGGAGDALSGFLAALLTQPTLQADICRTIRFAVWRHGVTADLLSRTKPNWIIEDLVEALSTSDAAQFR